jgi:hypothetical protein
VNTDRLRKYLLSSRNPDGRERLLSLARDADEQCIAEEIRLHRRLCLGLAGLAVLTLVAGFGF